MSKIRQILLLSLAIFMSITVFAACKTGGSKKPVLSIENAKTQFVVGEEFSVRVEKPFAFDGVICRAASEERNPADNFSYTS